MSKGRPLPQLPPASVAAAKQALLRADYAVVGGSCACNDHEPKALCCRFDVTGREPWLTEMEWTLVWAAHQRTGRRLSATTDADGSCPFLSSSSLCVIYESRPLGCRTHFCQHAEHAPPPARKALLEVVADLAALSQQPSRPLRSWVRDAKR
jgi:uncharacterized protein